MQLVRWMWRFALLGLLVSPAVAVELRQNKFSVGTNGLVSIPLTISNSGNEAISCTAEYAHWYSSELGVAAPGGMLRIALWFEPVTGTYVMLNDRMENLPIESLWCGMAGRAYVTRELLQLRRYIGASVSPQAVTCRADAGHLRCN